MKKIALALLAIGALSLAFAQYYPSGYCKDGSTKMCYTDQYGKRHCYCQD